MLTTSVPHSGQTGRVVGALLGAAMLAVLLLPGAVSASSAPTISSSASTTFTVGSAGSFTVTTTGNPTPALTKSGDLPSGVSFSDNGNGTATLAGTPASGTAGTYPLTITASNGILPNAVQSFTLTVSAAGPNVTINQASAQGDPTASSPINFTVVFSAPVTDFTGSDVALAGTAGGTKSATVTGSGTTYNVAVTGMTTAGTVVASVPAGVAYDASSRPNQASTSSDNSVTWTPVTTTLTLTNSASVITWREAIELDIQLGPSGANRSVILEATHDGVTWSTIASLATDSAGRATFSYRPARNLSYRARFTGTSDLPAVTSNTTRTLVRQIGLLRPNNAGTITSIARYKSITFTTTVRPSRPEVGQAKVTFVFYRRIAGVWTLITKRDVYASPLSVAKTTFKFSRTGNWSVRSIVNSTTHNLKSAWSPLERFFVRG
jgi:Putative Ig domain